MDKRIKTLLKTAKEAIKSQDYDLVLENCNSVLDNDPKNYTAHVFHGVAYKETGQIEKSVCSFKEAIHISCEQPLAWQGLGALYEVNTSKYHSELIGVYGTLLDILPSNDAKLGDIFYKLARLQALFGELDACLTTLDRWRESGAVCAANAAELLLLLPDKSVNLKQASCIVANLQHVLATADLDVQSSRRLFTYKLSLLHTLDRWKDIYEYAVRMRETLCDSVTASEWLLRCWLEGGIDITFQMADDHRKQEYVDTLVEHLSSEDADNVWLCLARAHRLADHCQWSQLMSLLSRLSSGPCVWLVESLRGRALLAAGRFGEAEVHLRRALDQCPAHVSSLALHLQLAAALVRQQRRSKAAAAHAILQQVTVDVGEAETCQYERVVWETRLVIGEVSLDVIEDHSVPVDIRARVLMRHCRWKDSVLLLEGCSEAQRSADVVRLLAIALWRSGEVVHSVDVLREAITLDPLHWLPFYLLARFLLRSSSAATHPGEQRRQRQRAVRCLEKACRLRPGERACCTMLGELYRTAGHHEQHETLLTAAATRCQSTGSWAWLSLGVLRLRSGDQTGAVTALQTAAKLCHLDQQRQQDDASVYDDWRLWHDHEQDGGALDDQQQPALIWECLGDAYTGRGALTSAQCAYQRAIDHYTSANCSQTSATLYCHLQLARVLHMLGQLQSAVEQYGLVLHRCPDYLPALFGAANTRLGLAHQLVAQYRHASARDVLQLSVHCAVAAVRQRPDLSCVWRVLAAVLHEAAALPAPLDWLYVPAHCCDDSGRVSWMPGSDAVSCGGDTRLSDVSLAELACRCYRHALHSGGDPCSLSHALAVSCLVGADKSGRRSTSLQHACDQDQWLLLAYNYAMSSVRMAGSSSGVVAGALWNTLAVCAVRRGRLASAQHACVRALRACDADSAVVWTNLAVVYLRAAEPTLAHEALCRAQSCMPEYSAAWTGQAMVAELLAPHQTADLFRHACSLAVDWSTGTSLQAAAASHLGFVHHAVSSSSQQQLPLCGAVYEASHFYTSVEHNSCVGWNLRGAVCELHGEWRAAATAYSRSLQLTLDQHHHHLADTVRVNLARALTMAGSAEKAVAQLNQLAGHNLASLCALALAYYRCSQWTDSFSCYEAAMKLVMADDDVTASGRGQLMVAAACVLYAAGDVAAARQLLLTSCQLQPPPPAAVMALAALTLRERSCQQHSCELVAACGREMAPLLLDIRHARHAALLLSQAAPGSDQAGAARVLQRACRLWPHVAATWHVLAVQLYSEGCEAAARHVALVALALSDKQARSHELVQVAVLASVCHVLCGDLNAALGAVQRALLMQPDSARVWCCMLYVLRRCDSSARTKCLVSADKMAAIETHTRHMCNEQNLLQWLDNLPR